MTERWQRPTGLDENGQPAVRRWRPSMMLEVNGVTFPPQPARKKPGDIKIQVKTPAGWRDVEMKLGAVLTDFFFENEDWLFPRPRLNGGMEHLGYLWDAAWVGWPYAETRLQEQKLRRRRKDAGDVA